MHPHLRERDHARFWQDSPPVRFLPAFLFPRMRDIKRHVWIARPHYHHHFAASATWSGPPARTTINVNWQQQLSVGFIGVCWRG